MRPPKEEILEAFKSLVKRKISLHRLILFGSHARGDAQPDSDVDLLVVVEEEDVVRARQVVSECAWEAGFGSGVILSPVVFTRYDWEEGPERLSLLAKAVAEEGIPV